MSVGTSNWAAISESIDFPQPFSLYDLGLRIIIASYHHREIMNFVHNLYNTDLDRARNDGLFQNAEN